VPTAGVTIPEEVTGAMSLPTAREVTVEVIRKYSGWEVLDVHDSGAFVESRIQSARDATEYTAPSGVVAVLGEGW
jgi:hypothetical protein